MLNVQNTIRILIADDHEMIRLGLRAILSQCEEWTIVAEAADGEEAVALAVDTRPHIGVIDYQLPLKNGFEVTRELRARLPETKIAIFTMHDDPVFAAKAFEVGATGYVTKTEATTHLLLAINALILQRPYVSSRTAAKLTQSFLRGTNRMNGMTPGAQVVRRLMNDGHPDQDIAVALDVPIDAVESFRSRLIGPG